ncbi:MAG: hypothetical protein AAGF95_19250 [Chloroflexota bacterium]
MYSLKYFFFRQVRWITLVSIIALVIYAYRGLFARPFAADDYQWLLNIYQLNVPDLIRASFQIDEQDHFYRPIMWFVWWWQIQWFGLEPAGYHFVSVVLHLTNALLLGGLTWRLGCRWSASIIAIGFVALHPALFEAVVWVSAQSELIATCLLLLMLHLWVSYNQVIPHQQTPVTLSRDETAPQQTITSDTSTHNTRLLSPAFHNGSVAAFLFIGGTTLALGLALFTKETAIIGLPLLLLLGGGLFFQRQDTSPWQLVRSFRHLSLYVLPAIVVILYLVLQLTVIQRNYLVQEGGYGLGWHVIFNPVRSLALIIAPLPGTEHGDAFWLISFGGLVSVGLLVLLFLGPWVVRYAILALLITLLPTAPFTSAPDSRYLYLPVCAAGLLLTMYFSFIQSSQKQTHSQDIRASITQRLVIPMVIIVLALWSTGEVATRESRFASASGPGGSLWDASLSLCAENRPARVVVVDPPLATVHADAIVRLACGPGVKPKIVTRDQAADEVGNRTVVIHFPQGSAEIELRTY